MEFDDVLPYIMFGIWFLLALSGMLLSARSLRREAEWRKAVFTQQHEWRKSDILEFPKLDRDFYDYTQASFENAGFSSLGDIEDVTLAGTAMNPRSVRRIMLSPDGKRVAEFWQIHFTPWKQLWYILSQNMRRPYVIRVFSENSAGHISSIVSMPDKLRPLEPPEFAVRHYPAGTAVEEVLSAFDNEYATPQTDDESVTFRFIDDVIASEQRQQTVRIAFRREAGLLTRQELLERGMRKSSVDGYLKAFNRQVSRLDKTTGGE